MAQELVKMNPLNSSEFVRRFNEKKKFVKLDLLLENTKKVMDKSSQKKLGMTN